VPIFGNRTLAAMLRDLSVEVRKQCQADIVGRLNSGGHTALAAEWELFVLRQLSRDDSLRLPPRDRPGVPDAIFNPSGGRPMVVEVTALNDEELEKRFADDALGMLFYRAINRLTGDPVGSVDVHTSWPIGADGLPQPGLPPRSRMHEFMKTQEVRQFVRTIATAPAESHRLEHRQGNASTIVTFRPGSDISSGSVSGLVARSFNPHNRGRLVRKLRGKAQQLSDADLQLPAVVVLCDADCRMLRETLSTHHDRDTLARAIFDHISGRPARSWPGPHGPWMVERGVKQQTTSINAVVILTVDEKWERLTNHVDRSVKASVIRNLGAAKFSLDDADLSSLVNRLQNDVPPVLRSPMNAKQKSRFSDNEGGGQVVGNRVKVSMLALQDLLTGRTSHETFVTRHGFIAEHLIRLAEQGHCISSLRVVKDEKGRDDDWVELDFSGIDPRNVKPLVERGGE